MSNIIKIALFKIKLNKNNLFLSDFKSLLSELSSKLDNVDEQDTRVLDSFNNSETSIWFDSFDYLKSFSRDTIFDDTVCFLLAKDMKFQFVEDKEKKRIKNMNIKPKQNPKIPAHCVYLEKDNILLMEQTNITPTEATLKRGIFKHNKLKEEDLTFLSINREDILERLSLFMESIVSIELEDINLEKYLGKSGGENNKLYSILKHPETKMGAKLFINSNDMRSEAVNFFYDTFHNIGTQELKNIKITYKDEHQKNDIIELYKNLIFLKIEKEVYHEDLSSLKKIEQRVEYSKNIYKSMIEAYQDEKNKS